MVPTVVAYNFEKPSIPVILCSAAGKRSGFPTSRAPVLLSCDIFLTPCIPTISYTCPFVFVVFSSFAEDGEARNMCPTFGTRPEYREWCVRKFQRRIRLPLVFRSPPSTILSPPTGCTNPKVKSSTYSTENQYFSGESVFIAQVEVDCNGEVDTLCTLHTTAVSHYPGYTSQMSFTFNFCV